MSELLVPARGLEAVAFAILERGGSQESEARVVADHLVRANLAGHDSHGIGMLPTYVRSLRAGLVQPNQEPELVREDGSILVFDGHRGYGQAVGRTAMAQALARCRESGLVLMTLRNAHHLGRIGTYGEQAIAAGLVSLHFVNVTDHGPLVAPFRGTDGRFSTNPICLAMPGSERQPPILLDMATSRIALGKVRVALNKGEELALGMILDADGRPSSDPRAMFQEPRGALLPLGEHKGYGLALFCELLGGLLSGGGTIQPGNPRRNGIVNNMLTLVLDPERLVERPCLERELEALVDYCKASPPQRQGEPVLVPGDPERASRSGREARGIPVDATTWEEILVAGGLLGLERQELEALAQGARP